MFRLAFLLPLALLTATSFAAPLYSVEFSKTALGKTPEGWQDLGTPHASPNWGTDGKGLLRVLWKGETGLIAYAGDKQLADGTIKAIFAKTPDPGISFGIAGRIQDAKNFYLVRFSGQYELKLLKVTNGAEEVLAEWVTRDRYLDAEEWAITLELNGPRITGRLYNAKGVETARVDALDKAPLPAGMAGLQATNFSAAKSFTIEPLDPASAYKATDESKKKIKKQK